MDKYVYEMRLLKAEAAPRVAGRRRWRWDLTVQHKEDGRYPGVKNSRMHMNGSSGYAYTRWGALRAIGRAYDKAQEAFPIYGKTV